ncbi:DUF4386 domain-containing protein [uncultured Microscilla sp.]|uniref:DUF4386 domain-containing protein n=1 Tax=uncultured Microscilla sp. TaxID=432653 RepID=UPI002612B478|nr:DUF4386 domain-containing protein [uncultured Microscilla sp.]
MKRYSPKTIARVAGLFYLAVIVCGVFAEFFVRGKLMVSGNATATTQNIMASPDLFRLGFVSDLMMLSAFLLLAFTLYVLFKSLSKSLSLLFLLLVVISTAILCLNMLNHLAPLLMLTKGNYMAAFSGSQGEEQVLFFLDMHKNGYMIAQIFYGAWLFPLGYLTYKSSYFPKVLGILLMLGAVSYLTDFFIYFLLPNNYRTLSPIITLPVDIAEFSMCLWLLIKGVKTPKKNTSQPTLATA